MTRLFFNRLLRLLAASDWFPIRARMRMLAMSGMSVGVGAQMLSGNRIRFGRLTLGEKTFVGEAGFFEDYDSIRIGRGTWVGPQCRFLTATHAIGTAEQRAGEWMKAPIDVGSGCWLGAGATVLPGVTIGHGCVIGAGAVVTSDCAPNGLYAGVPAARKRDLDDTPPAVQLRSDSGRSTAGPSSSIASK